MTWLGVVDVRGLGELDRIVEFRRGRVGVYSASGDGEATAARPPRGQGLNAPAMLTLHGIRAKNAEATMSDFEAKLRATAQRAGWTHVNYDARGGTWVVAVGCF